MRLGLLGCPAGLGRSSSRAGASSAVADAVRALGLSLVTLGIIGMIVALVAVVGPSGLRHDAAGLAVLWLFVSCIAGFCGWLVLDSSGAQ